MPQMAGIRPQLTHQFLVKIRFSPASTTATLGFARRRIELTAKTRGPLISIGFPPVRMVDEFALAIYRIAIRKWQRP